MVSFSYLTDIAEGIGMSVKEISGQGVRQSVKVVWSDFDLLTLTRYLSYQFDIKLRWCWRFREAEIGSSCIAIIALSSANSATIVFKEVSWSAAYILYKIGESMPSRGTRALIFAMFEDEEPNLAWKWRSITYDLIGE